MKLKQLFVDDSAVSPVIGVILMVAITVILAAVIGSFVLNLGGSLQQSSPQATFDFSYNGTSNVTMTHTNGDSIPGDQLNTSLGGGSWDVGLSGNWSDSGSVSAGTSIEKTPANEGFNGGTIRVIWTSESGENSATLSRSTAPS